MKSIARIAALAASLALLHVAPLHAQAPYDAVTVQYDLRLTGLPIAEMTVSLVLTDTAYMVNGVGKTVGVVDLLSKVRFSGNSKGQIAAGSVLPRAHTYVYSERGKSRTVTLTFDEDQKPSIVAVPPFTPSPMKIPLPADKLVGVIDVASQFVLPAVAGRAALDAHNCERTLSLSTGEVVVEAKISHVESNSGGVLRGTRYKGPYLHCKASLHPVGGHKIGGMISKLEGDGTIDIWVAPTLGGRYFMPMKVTVPTSFGTAEFVMRKIATQPRPVAAGLGR